ncbi:universal stress protein [Actinokineospora sp. NBRC 105648]|uniref:universal stress protein n=1 Tax=Actinokineospora sp. NBRC 105648 TaxID=3032206 RepID=UPI0024A35F84|nr:universal stress protein [Actinokineospora sp. NBRC 105648]GLZ36683.1 universal stress protein [Actinokineospora sp. NBRC 105648]
MITPRHIVVGFDDSPRSRSALRWALVEAEATGAEVSIVRVLAPRVAFVPAAPMAPQPYGGPPRTRPDHVDDLAHEVAELADSLGCPAPAIAQVEGRTGRVLAEAAAGADLIAIGAHHSPAYLASGVGAFAADCLRHARCPVVIVPDW